jgi:hypothetical protein
MRQFFAEKDGELSMKRLIGFICTVALCIKLVHQSSESLVLMVGGLAAAALGYTTAEKIFKK